MTFKSCTILQKRLESSDFGVCGEFWIQATHGDQWPTLLELEKHAGVTQYLVFQEDWEWGVRREEQVVKNSWSGDIRVNGACEHSRGQVQRADRTEAGSFPGTESRAAWEEGDEDPGERGAGEESQGHGLRILASTLMSFFEKLNIFQSRILLSPCCSIENLKHILPSVLWMDCRGSRGRSRWLSASSVSICVHRSYLPF